MKVWRFIGFDDSFRKGIAYIVGCITAGTYVEGFLIDKIEAKKLFDITSYTMPHSVFVNEENMIELPSIEIYYKKMPRAMLRYAIEKFPENKRKFYLGK